MDTDLLQRPDDAEVAPGLIFSRHLQSKLLRVRAWIGLGFATFGTIVLAGDETAIPAQDGIRRGEGADMLKGFAAEGLALQSEAKWLLIGEAYALGSEVLLEYAVFLQEIVDGGLLVAVHPVGEGKQEEVERGRAPAEGHDSLLARCLGNFAVGRESLKKCCRPRDGIARVASATEGLKVPRQPSTQPGSQVGGLAPLMCRLAAVMKEIVRCVVGA